MRRSFLISALTGVLGLMATSGHAATIGLFDWGFNVDGVTFCDIGSCDDDGLDPSTDLPGFINAGAFDFDTGIGKLSISVSGAGSHSIDLFVDHDLDEMINQFYNESGAANGTPATGQSWEIDEPGWVFGDIFDNFLDSTLDNSNNLPAGFEDDVSMALGWDFSLGANDHANVEFALSEVVPRGFFISQTDPDSDATIYFSSALEIRSEAAQIPEPSTLSLLAVALVGLGDLHRRQHKIGSSQPNRCF